MPRLSVRFVCSECGAAQAKWMGRCPECGRWHTLEEEALREAPPPGAASVEPRVVRLGAGEGPAAEERLPTGSAEFDRVLGGGLVPGSLVLLGGDPGIGKSTLLLQACFSLSARGLRVLYASGEESAPQIALRARRLGGPKEPFDLLCDTSLEALVAAAERLKPAVLVVDSVQTFAAADLGSTAGSVSQVREVASRVMSLAKRGGAAAVLVGHVTKEGTLAGPRVLEHLVDTVLTFEGERHRALRMLRAAKNRFGGTQELGLFEMAGDGLRAADPAGGLASPAAPPREGVAVVASLEGSRPLLIEVQALLTPSHYGTPQRASTGVDPYRLSVLYAVLEKRAGLALYGHDSFVAVAGGLRLEGPAGDLAVAAAVASSLRGRPLPPGWVLAAEIGLGGELRPVPGAEDRLKEASRLGFRKALLAKEDPASMRRLGLAGMEVGFAADIEEAFRLLWEG